eukprot:6585142-Prorocentrum_lima.AAC.1
MRLRARNCAGSSSTNPSATGSPAKPCKTSETSIVPCLSRAWLRNNTHDHGDSKHAVQHHNTIT